MNIWLLVVMMYSPAGDLVGRYTYDYNSFQECVQQAFEKNKETHPMGITTRAICKKVTI